MIITSKGEAMYRKDGKKVLVIAIRSIVGPILALGA